MTSNIDGTGVARYPVGTCPVLDPATGATLIDALGRRSYTTSIALGPTIGKNIALAYLPHAYCQVRLSPSGLATASAQRTMPESAISSLEPQHA